MKLRWETIMKAQKIKKNVMERFGIIESIKMQ